MKNISHWQFLFCTPHHRAGLHNLHNIQEGRQGLATSGETVPKLKEEGNTTEDE